MVSHDNSHHCALFENKSKRLLDGLSRKTNDFHDAYVHGYLLFSVVLFFAVCFKANRCIGAVVIMFRMAC